MLAHRMSGFHGAVYLTVRPSLLLRRTAASAHLLAACAMAALHPATVAQGLLIAAIALHGWYLHLRLSRPRAGDVAAVLLSSTDEWRVTLYDGRVLGARLARPPHISVYLTALSLTLTDGHTRSVLLLADNVDPDACRRLRVRLGRAHEGEL